MSFLMKAKQNTKSEKLHTTFVKTSHRLVIGTISNQDRRHEMKDTTIVFQQPDRIMMHTPFSVLGLRLLALTHT